MEKDDIHISGLFGQLRQLDHLLPHPIKYRVGIALLFSASLLAWLLIKPASHDIVVSVDNLAQAGSFLVAILLCFDDLLRPRRLRPAQFAQVLSSTRTNLGTTLDTLPVWANYSECYSWANRLALLYANSPDRCTITIPGRCLQFERVSVFDSKCFTWRRYTWSLWWRRVPYLVA